MDKFQEIIKDFSLHSMLEYELGLYLYFLANGLTNEQLESIFDSKVIDQMQTALVEFIAKYKDHIREDGIKLEVL